MIDTREQNVMGRRVVDFCSFLGKGWFFYLSVTSSDYEGGEMAILVVV